MNDTMVFYGSNVKLIDSKTVGGYLVRFSDANNPDLAGDFFTSDTDFVIPELNNAKLAVFYHHGFDDIIGLRKIGVGAIKMDEVGLWIESQLSLRDEYEQAILDLAKRGKLSWSSGAASHLIKRVKVGKSYFVRMWGLAEASLTPTPAEPKNTVVPIKSLIKGEEYNNDFSGQTLSESTDNVIKLLTAWAERMNLRHETRLDEGRDLSESQKNSIKRVADCLNDILANNDAQKSQELDDKVRLLRAQMIQNEVLNIRRL